MAHGKREGGFLVERTVWWNVVFCSVFHPECLTENVLMDVAFSQLFRWKTHLLIGHLNTHVKIVNMFFFAAA